MDQLELQGTIVIIIMNVTDSNTYMNNSPDGSVSKES